MKKFAEISSVVAAGLTVFVLVTQLPSVFERKDINFSDDELRQKAFKTNIFNTPKNYGELLELLDDPNNPMTIGKIALGKRLFNDKRLSSNNDISCASCHKIKEGGDDNIPTAIGHKDRKNPFHLNTPTVLNSAISFKQFWNGSAKNLQEQAKGPIQATFEMNMKPKILVEKLKKDNSYIKEFNNVFKQGNESITFDNITKAIAVYEKTLLTRSKFDDFLEGDNNAISDKAKKGLTTFIVKGCTGCHTGISLGGQSIQKFPLRTAWNEWLNLKISKDDDSLLPKFEIVDYSFPFENKGNFKGLNNTYRFKVPNLRDIERTAPYFHNGAIKELSEAVRIMGKYQLGIEFSKEQIDEIVEFLKSLNGQQV